MNLHRITGSLGSQAQAGKDRKDCHTLPRGFWCLALGWRLGVVNSQHRSIVADRLHFSRAGENDR